MSFDTAWPPSKTRDVELTYQVYSAESGRLPRINELYILADKIYDGLVSTERILPSQSGNNINGNRRSRVSYAISAPLNVRPGRIHFKCLYLSTKDQYDIYSRVPAIYAGTLTNVPGSGIDSVVTDEAREDFADLYELLIDNIPVIDSGEIVLSNVKFMSVNFGIGAIGFPS